MLGPHFANNAHGAGPRGRPNPAISVELRLGALELEVLTYATLLIHSTTIISKCHASWFNLLENE